ncbi:MAG: hypothetical protein ACFCUT_22190 [Kiloniellaceae bacterium]
MIKPTIIACFLCISIVGNFVVSRDVIGQVLDSEKAEVLEIVSRRVIETRCNHEKYLGCFRIDSVQCFSESESIVEDCKKLMAPAMPPLKEEAIGSFRTFGEEFSRCMTERHLNVGQYNRQEIKNCLGAK